VAAPFPFSAIVGQETLKRALLLGVIQPSLGGVLIRGTKGVAKSTAVRALAALLPPLRTVTGCPFQRSPGEVIPDWPLPADQAVVTRPVPLVELPLGATEDRVLGTLHLEKALRGERAFEPGLLAAANRGVLYVDEVNLLPDPLVDVLLDSAASGVHRVEREGLSLTHPARFLLVGTMNPEEGELRPQLLDRFGLVAEVTDLTQPADRAEAVRRRLAYETSPDDFLAAWRSADAAEAERVVLAQALLPRVVVPESLLRSVSERCLAAGVEGLRADLTVCRAACAWAAYHGRTEVAPADVDAVAELALAHRRTRPPEPPGPGGRGQGAGARGQAAGNGSRQQAASPPAAPSTGSASEVLPISGIHEARVRPPTAVLARCVLAGRWKTGGAQRRVARVGPVAGYQSGAALAWAPTLRAAAPYQGERRGNGDAPWLILHAADLRAWPRRGPVGCLLLFLVDASGSMAAWRRMRQTKAAVLALLVQAYQRGDRVALLAFRGGGADLVLPPRRGLLAARHALENLPVGGSTPLAGGLGAARRLIRAQQRRDARQAIWTVVLTDGRANVAMASRDPWQDALAEARRLASCRTACLVVDTETGPTRFGRAGELARALGASCLPLEGVLGRALPDRWRRAV
jgi:magnesium chelatase subunit D